MMTKIPKKPGKNHSGNVNLAVIPARGGSKRIPHKNIRTFIDRPIIAYSIQKAWDSGLFDRVIVSTDDPEIARVATQFGAEIPFFRPESLADDYVGTDAVIKHAIEWYLERGQNFDFVCGIYATAPMLQIEHIIDGYNKLVASDKLFAFGVTSYCYPVQRGLRLVDNGIEPCFSEYTTSRSQDLEPIYHDTGQFYWGRPDAFIDEVEQFSQSSIPVYIPRYYVQDIDTIEDWVYAEAMYMALDSLNKFGTHHETNSILQVPRA